MSHHGVHRARVHQVVDPAGQGRVQILLPPALAGEARHVFAAVLHRDRAADPGDHGLQPGDQVLVAFEDGDLERPIVLGLLWAAPAAVPAPAPATESRPRAKGVVPVPRLPLARPKKIR